MRKKNFIITTLFAKKLYGESQRDSRFFFLNAKRVVLFLLLMATKDIAGYEGLYKITTEGVVISTNYRMTGKEKELKAGTNRRGYKYVILCKNGKRKSHSVHRLVANAFIDNSLTKPCINHKNSIRTDNRIENLEFCTHKENTIHGYLFGNNNGKCEKPINQLDLQGNFIRSFKSTMDAEKYLGIKNANSNICKCLKRKYKYAYGYKWK